MFDVLFSCLMKFQASGHSSSGIHYIFSFYLYCHVCLPGQRTRVMCGCSRDLKFALHVVTVTECACMRCCIGWLNQLLCYSGGFIVHVQAT